MILFWFILTAAILVGIQQWIYRKFAFTGVEYTRRFTKQACFQDEKVLMIETLSNKKRLPMPWLYVESSLESDLQFKHSDNFTVSSGSYFQNHQSYFTLGSYQKITRTHELSPRRRGVYQLKTVSLTTGDLLGIVNDVKQIPLQSSLIVYPKPTPINWDRIPYHSMQGDHIVKRFIMPDPFLTAGTRPYSYGDSLKSVNWKATARTNSLHVHQYEFTSDRKLLIVVNVDDHESMWKDVTNVALVEMLLNYAAGISRQAIDLGIEVGFIANMRTLSNSESTFVESARGEGHWYTLLDTMAHLMLERTEVLPDLLTRKAKEGLSKYDIVVLSAFWNKASEEAAQLLRYNDNSLLVLTTSDLSEYDGREAVI